MKKLIRVIEEKNGVFTVEVKLMKNSKKGCKPYKHYITYAAVYCTSRDHFLKTEWKEAKEMGTFFLDATFSKACKIQAFLDYVPVE